ncbi:hypothetical protein L1887_54456 [Cichorium endivia]|nr:hypothetical protein L1887_54456 [Cichorium endivia]
MLEGGFDIDLEPLEPLGVEAERKYTQLDHLDEPAQLRATAEAGKYELEPRLVAQKEPLVEKRRCDLVEETADECTCCQVAHAVLEVRKNGLQQVQRQRAEQAQAAHVRAHQPPSCPRASKGRPAPVPSPSLSLR